MSEVTSTEQKVVAQKVIDSLSVIKGIFEKHWNGEKSIDLVNIINVVPVIMELQAQKSSFYGRSYCRHGELSIFFNTERKWDRLLNIMEKAIDTGNMNNLYTDNSGTPTETFFDTLIDLASYSLLWVGYVFENHPEVFEKFIETNKLNK